MKETQQYESMRIHYFDNIGIGLSGICMIHCLFMPVVLMVLSFLSLGGIPLSNTSYLEALHHWAHPIAAIVIGPLTMLAMWSGFRHHRRYLVLLPLAMGLTVVLTISLLMHEELHPVTEAVFSLLGGGLLLTGHWWNKLACK